MDKTNGLIRKFAACAPTVDKERKLYVAGGGISIDSKEINKPKTKTRSRPDRRTLSCLCQMKHPRRLGRSSASRRVAGDLQPGCAMANELVFRTTAKHHHLLVLLTAQPTAKDGKEDGGMAGEYMR